MITSIIEKGFKGKKKKERESHEMKIIRVFKKSLFFLKFMKLFVRA